MCDTFFDHPINFNEWKKEEKGVWSIVRSPMYPLMVLFTYYIIVILTQNWMNERTRIQTGVFLRYFNAFLAICYFVVGSRLVYYGRHFSFCQSVPHLAGECCNTYGYGKADRSEVKVASSLIAFHFLKSVQLLEVFFLLISKRCIPAYYFFYQFSVVLLSWMAAVLAPGGTSPTIVLISSFSYPFLFGYDILRTIVLSARWPCYNVVAISIELIEFTFITILATAEFYEDCQYNVYGPFFVLAFVIQFLFMIAQDFIFGNPRTRLQPWCHAASS